MFTMKAGLDLIKRFEGLELKAYQDIAGIWTIGYGHTEGFKSDPPAFHAESEITEIQAHNLLRLDIEGREKKLDEWLKHHGVMVNQNQFDALMSLIYNIGWGNFSGSIVASRLRRKDVIGAADAFGLWNKATVKGVLREVRGLTRRRAAERELFLTPIKEPDAERNTARLQPTDENRNFWNRARSRCNLK